MIVRPETWGIVRYDPVYDEFSAEMASDGDLPKIVRPLSAGCLITGKCNLRCPHCYGNLEALPKSELSVAEWSAVFRMLVSCGVMRVDISGGEPTIRRDVCEIIAIAIDLGLNVVLSTNGTLISTPQGFPSQTRFHISLDSGLEDLHESNRLLPTMRPSHGSFRKATSLIQSCLEAGHRVRVLTSIGNFNEDLLFELGEKVAMIGVQEWNISRVLPAGRAKRNYETRWTPTSSSDLATQVVCLQEAYPWMRIRYSNRTAQNGYFLLILPDGTVATQYTDERDKVPLGCFRDLTFDFLSSHESFDLESHTSKWISEVYQYQGAWMSLN